MRDDFSETVKRTVSSRVANVCSRPGCGAVTSGPQVDVRKALNVGVAAHITAASPGGPRYDPRLSEEERRHPDNAIWLCQTCAKLVDNDQARFTADELRSWKRLAETEALRRIGKPKASTPEADLRLKVLPAIVASPGAGTFAVLTITAQNYGNSDVFLNGVALELDDDRQFVFARDAVNNQWYTRRRLRPGEAFTYHVDPGALVRQGISPDKVIGVIAKDAIDRVYKSTEEDLPGLLRHILEYRDEDHGGRHNAAELG